LRTLTSADGGTIVERVEALDEAAHRLSYALLTNTPFRNCLTTMAVRDLVFAQMRCSAMAWLAPSPRPSPPMLGEREMTVLSRAFPPPPALGEGPGVGASGAITGEVA
jgi:hypothetical protein